MRQPPGRFFFLAGPGRPGGRVVRTPGPAPRTQAVPGPPAPPIVPGGGARGRRERRPKRPATRSSEGSVHSRPDLAAYEIQPGTEASREHGALHGSMWNAVLQPGLRARRPRLPRWVRATRDVAPPAHAEASRLSRRGPLGPPARPARGGGLAPTSGPGVPHAAGPARPRRPPAARGQDARAPGKVRSETGLRTQTGPWLIRKEYASRGSETLGLCGDGAGAPLRAVRPFTPVGRARQSSQQALIRG